MTGPTGSKAASDWLEWFLTCLLRAVQGAAHTLASVLSKARCREHWSAVSGRQSPNALKTPRCASS
ncbi:MAG: hypothetical protein ACOYLM_10325, partial [Methylococcaceae bacterium]